MPVPVQCAEQIARSRAVSEGLKAFGVRWPRECVHGVETVPNYEGDRHPLFLVQGGHHPDDMRVRAVQERVAVLPIWSVPMIWSLPLRVLLKSMNSILPSSKYDEGGWKVIRGRGSRASSTVAVVFGDLLAAVHSASAVPLGLFGGGLVG